MRLTNLMRIALACGVGASAMAVANSDVERLTADPSNWAI